MKLPRIFEVGACDYNAGKRHDKVTFWIEDQNGTGKQFIGTTLTQTDMCSMRNILD